MELGWNWKTYQCLYMILLSRVTLVSQIGKQNSVYLGLTNAEELGQTPLPVPV
jgi:hypothetical protein